MEYREKRSTGRLAPLQLTQIPAGSWSRFASKRRQKSGGSLEQYKHPCLIPDLESSNAFLRAFAPGSGLTGQAT